MMKKSIGQINVQNQSNAESSQSGFEENRTRMITFELI